MNSRIKAVCLATAILGPAILMFFGCAGIDKKKTPLAAQAGSPVVDLPIAEKAAPLSPEPAPRPREISNNVLIFKDIRQVDLNNDGKKEIIAVFSTQDDFSGVKVIDYGAKDSGKVIFEQIFPTPDTQVAVYNGECVVIAEDFDLTGERRVRKTYFWNGKAFVSRY